MVATLFDFNGVLVDDEHVHLNAFRSVLQPWKVSISDQDYEERYLGFDDVGAFRAMLRDAGHHPTSEDIDQLVDAKKGVYFAQIESALRIFPGAEELVRRRAALGPIGVVSGALEAEIRYCLARMGVLDLFSFIIPAEHTKACKPDPEGYFLGLAALRRLTGNTGDTVVIEDSLAGIQAAKAAGLRCVAVAHSYPKASLLDAGADAVGATLSDLTDPVVDGTL